jgi:Stage II sporulation protein E (SpoIIE)
MADDAEDKRLTRAENARYVLAATVLSISFFFLIYARDRTAWSWRLVLLGAVAGPLAYAVSLALRLLLRALLRRRHRTLAKALVTPLDFFAGCGAFMLAWSLLERSNLAPPRHSADDHRIMMVVVGLMTAEVGVLFYLFHLTSKRLMRSVRRIKDQEFAERELELARTIQQRLLPPESVTGNGYRIRARNVAAQYVAGDFYDAFHLADGTLGVAVADVSGKGIGASLLMATVKAMLPLVAEGRRPSETLTELNRKLRAELPRHAFVALSYARLDPGAGTLELSNAGLPDQYLLRAGAAAEMLSVGGPRLPLGSWRDVVYESMTVSLRAGDAVLWLTDGLAEATTASGEQLGYEKLLQEVNDAALAPADMLDTLFERVGLITSRKLEDDCTALVLRMAAMDGPGRA